MWKFKYLSNSFQTLEDASKELQNSRLFLKLLETVLRTVNRMNVGTNGGDAKAFKLNTLLKLSVLTGRPHCSTLWSMKSAYPKGMDSSLHLTEKDDRFRKQGLQLVAGLGRDHVKKAAGMDFDVLRGYASKLEMGLDKVRYVLKHEKLETEPGKLFDSMKKFIKEAEEDISRVKGDERRALWLVKEVTEYFHGDSAKEEAHPLRMFMVVRDFLRTLDNVCKEVKTMQERTVMTGSARSFRISATAS